MESEENASSKNGPADLAPSAETLKALQRFQEEIARLKAEEEQGEFKSGHFLNPMRTTEFDPRELTVTDMSIYEKLLDHTIRYPDITHHQQELYNEQGEWREGVQGSRIDFFGYIRNKAQEVYIDLHREGREDEWYGKRR